MMDDVSIINSNENVDEENNTLNNSNVQIQKNSMFYTKYNIL